MSAEPLLSVDDARARILERLAPLPSEVVPLADAGSSAVGRFVAEPLQARRDLPGVDNSAMDGVGVVVEDVAAASKDRPVELALVGASLAGHAAEAPRIASGQAVRIMTGAPIPPGVTAVVMRESTDERDVERGRVRILEAAKPGQHIRRRGEDVALGDVVAQRGARLTPARINLLLAAGHTVVSTPRRPHIAILASGDELVDVDAAAGAPELRATDVVNSNAHALAAACRALGASVRMLGIARDSLQAHTDKIAPTLGDVDVLLTIGGVSMGTHDFVRPALAALGVELVLWKVAMRPGKPIAFGQSAGAQTTRATSVFGLPGNPVSAMVSFALFVRPALSRLGGDVDARPRLVPAVLDAPFAKKPGLEHWARAIVDGGSARVLDRQGSHQISGLADANALVCFARERDSFSAGEVVPALLLDV